MNFMRISRNVAIDSRLDYSDYTNILLLRLIRQPVLFYVVSNQKIPLCCFMLFLPMLDHYWSTIHLYEYLIIKLESVQCRFTKRLRGYHQILYAERLVRLNAEILELRNLRLDLTIFRIIRGFVNINCDKLLVSLIVRHPILEATILRNSKSIVIQIVALIPLSVVILMFGTVCQLML